MTDIEKAAETLGAHPDFRVLRRLRISDAHVFAENVTGEPCGRLAVIDTETTALKLNSVIESLILLSRPANTGAIRGNFTES